MKNKQCILHANINNQGGAFTLVYQAQTKLQEKYIFDYFSSNEFVENDTYRELQKMGSKCIGGINGKCRLLKPYRIYKKFKNYLRDNPYKVVHIHADTAWKISIFYFAAQSAGIEKIIVHSHSSGINGHFRLINYILHFFMRPLIKKAKYKCACSKVAAKWMYGTDKNIIYIQNGVDVDKYRYNSSSRENIRQLYGIKNTQIAIGTAGDFSYSKNPEFIYNLIAKFKKDKRYVFILVGNGSGKNKLENKIKKWGLHRQIIFTGMVTNVEAYLSAMDIFILPSRFEGLPMCALEAQVSGLHTFVSDNVTPECECSKHFTSLQLDIEQWATMIHKVDVNYDRNDQSKYLLTERMKITETAKQFEELYEKG